MEDKIKQLIEHHKFAKLECREYLKDLYSLTTDDMSKEDENALTNAITRAKEESAWRSVFISNLEDLFTSPETNLKIEFDEKKDKF